MSRSPARRVLATTAAAVLAATGLAWSAPSGARAGDTGGLRPQSRFLEHAGSFFLQQNRRSSPSGRAAAACSTPMGRPPVSASWRRATQRSPAQPERWTCGATPRAWPWSADWRSSLSSPTRTRTATVRRTGTTTLG